MNILCITYWIGKEQFTLGKDKICFYTPKYDAIKFPVVKDQMKYEKDGFVLDLQGKIVTDGKEYTVDFALVKKYFLDWIPLPGPLPGPGPDMIVITLVYNDIWTFLSFDNKKVLKIVYIKIDGLLKTINFEILKEENEYGRIFDVNFPDNLVTKKYLILGFKEQDTIKQIPLEWLTEVDNWYRDLIK